MHPEEMAETAGRRVRDRRRVQPRDRLVPLPTLPHACSLSTIDLPSVVVSPLATCGRRIDPGGCPYDESE
jgi:hypothetical protein